MRLTNAIRAAGAVALAAFLSPAASAGDPFDAILVIEGSWGWAPDEIEDAEFGTCEKQPMQIWLTENNTRYHSRIQHSDREYAARFLLQRVTIGDDPGMLIQYEGEARIDDNGDPVAWYLVMPDQDRFYWVRRDWVGQNRRTAHLERCDTD